MGTMLKVDTTPIEPVPISVPAVIPPAAAPVGVETLPMAPQPVRLKRHHWGRATARVLKICLLLSEIPIILALIGYAGVLHLLPATPPTAQLSAAGPTTHAAPAVYCWFRPGHSDCVDPSAPAPSALPVVAVAKNSPLALTFSYPPPTGCATTARLASAPASAGTPAGVLAASGARSLMLARYSLAVALAPGLYRVDLACQWSPLSALRWLQGSGTATYTFGLRVTPPATPTKPPTKPPAK
jgi:hypothetical protein